MGKYDLYGTLGEGAFGKVKYAVNTETNEAVAIKILDKDKIQTRNMGAQIKKEISIMKMINHHHVVGVRDVFATSAKIFIVLEFVGGGELFDKIANEGKLPEEKARFYFKQLVEGLEHCHNNGICHRDLKPENLLLDTEGNLKISDFGFSTLNIGDADGDGGARAELLHTTCGTPNYVAPEVLGKDGYDGKKADVWSIGVILYVLLAGYLPFDENTMVALFQKIKNADFEYPDWFSDDARDLLDKTLVPDPHKRIKLADMKAHAWMQGADSGPTPSHADHSAATAGAPPALGDGNSVPPVPAAAAAAAGEHSDEHKDKKHHNKKDKEDKKHHHNHQQEEANHAPPAPPTDAEEAALTASNGHASPAAPAAEEPAKNHPKHEATSAPSSSTGADEPPAAAKPAAAPAADTAGTEVKTSEPAASKGPKPIEDKKPATESAGGGGCCVVC